MINFNYQQAFSRNLGWVTPNELAILKSKRIAIAGMGGVGGVHLITLVRMGFENFNLADFDHYELHNFNRQYGASMDTLGKDKLQVMVEAAKSINPNINVKLFPTGVTTENVNQFLHEVDLYVDGLDFFALEARILVFDLAEKMQIPVTTVAPIGMGAALINFLPGHMSYRNYFGFKPKDKIPNLLKFLIGLSPKMPHLASLVDRSYSDITKEKTASTPMGCQLSAGVAATEALKILLKRGPVTSAPTSIHFDAYSHQIKRTRLIGGYKNPLFIIKLFIIRFLLARLNPNG